MQQSSAGGPKLRALRSHVGKTMAELEALCGIGISHLHRIEAGRIKKPDYETLDLILEALNASFLNRREVLEAFGYKAPYQLPTAEEIEQAREMCAHELHDVTHPVYLMDDGHRLLTNVASLSQSSNHVNE